MTFIHRTNTYGASKCSSTGNIGLPALLLPFYNPFLTQSGPSKTPSVETSHSFPALRKYRAETALHNLASACAYELISSNLPFHPPGFSYAKRLSVPQKVPHPRSFAHAIFMVENALHCESVHSRLLLIQISA